MRGRMQVCGLALLLAVLVPCTVFGCARGQENVRKEPAADSAAASKGKIAFIVAPEGFQEKEFGIPKEKLEKEGFAVVVVSLKEGEAKGASGGSVKVDLTLDKLAEQLDDYKAVVFVGGPGSAVYHENATAHKVAKDAVDKGKVVAAICLAPFTLARAHVLDGKDATAWTDDEEFSPAAFEKLGAKYKEGPVVTSGKIVTANGPAAAEAFADAILALLR